MNPNPSLHLMYFMLNFKPLAARRFSGFYSHSSSLGFLGHNAPPKQKQGLPLLSLPTSPKREPTEPPAVVLARRVGDTAHVSSVSAQHSWHGTKGWGEGGSGRVGGRGVQLGGRPPAKGLTFWSAAPRRPLRNPLPCPSAPARLAARGGRIFLNFNTKGILGRRKCITKKEGLGAGRGGCFPPCLHPRPPGALGSRDETLRVPPSPQEPGEFKQGAPPPSLQPPARYQQWWVASALGSHRARAPRRRGLELPLARLTHLFASPLLSFRVRQHLGLRLFFCP